MYTKYVYGNGLIGEETNGQFKTYHFDYRGSTVAITDSQGNVTDRFKYNTYGKVIEHTGNSDVIFKYNGRDGVITEPNGLYYMRARYYSPDLMRFINADILSGSISNAITLNRYAYANGNPVSNIDPFGLEASRGENSNEISYGSTEYIDIVCQLLSYGNDYYGKVEDIKAIAQFTQMISGKVKFVRKGEYILIKGDRQVLDQYGIKQTRIRADNVKKFKGINDLLESQSFKGSLKNSFDAPGVILDTVGIVAETIYEINKYESKEDKAIVGLYTATTSTASTVASAFASAGAVALATKIGTAAGTTIAPGVGTAIGFAAGFLTGVILDFVFDTIQDNYIDDIVENN